MIKLSIIVPVYNVEKYLKQCVDSILNQTMEDFELILVNDGSTDTSGNICDDFQKLDSRIKVIHKENGGQSSARNKGLDIACGEYIGFVDSDDWIENIMYERLIIHGKENSSDIVACDYFEVQVDGRKIKHNKNSKNVEFTREEALLELYQHKILTYSQSNKIYKKFIFENLRYKEGIIFEDQDLSYKIIQKANKISYIKEALYYYRYNPTSTTRGEFTLKNLEHFYVASDMHKFYCENYPQVMDYVYKDVVFIGVETYSKLKFQNINGIKLKDYNFLIEYDKKKLRKLLVDIRINFKERLKLFMLIYMPNIFIKIRVYRISKGQI